MLKLMNSVFILVLFCGGLDLSHGEKLKCEFKKQYYHVVGTVYSCFVTSLDNSYDNMTIDGYTGTHLANKNDKDVKGIWIQRKNSKYIPGGLGSFSNLLALLIDHSQLVEIRSKDFQGMQNLEYLSLYENKLTSVPSDAFSMLIKLKHISLGSNQIKYIGSGSFDQLTNLNFVGLNYNICVKKNYEGSSAITQMREDIKVNCEKPNDIIQYEIEHKIRDESTRNRKEFKLLNQKMDKTKDENQGQLKALNDMIKTLIKATEEHQKDRDEILKLKSELSTAKEEQRMEQEVRTKAINEVTKERDELKKGLTDLKKELSEAKETIDQKLPKMEQTINEFHMEVMDQKIERHHQRELYREIRSKLMKCEKEKLEV